MVMPLCSYEGPGILRDPCINIVNIIIIAGVVIKTLKRLNLISILIKQIK